IPQAMIIKRVRLRQGNDSRLVDNDRNLPAHDAGAQEENMKRYFMALALTLLTVSAHQQMTNAQVAQSRCSLTEANAPNVRGIKLGMSTEQLLALFPGSGERADIKEALNRARTASGNEAVQLSFEPATYSTKDKFAQVDQVSATIHKGRVVSFIVAYTGPPNGPTWRTVDEWVAKLSESLSLPGGQAWSLKPSETPIKVLKCSGVEIEAAAVGGSGSVRVSNTDIQKEAPQTSNADQEKKRREFKP
ncbi:MAG TPA: hypothetical protein VJQ56_08280, partial [Blastocatellia bacterium]|nr:hypothetical protein [Blastocatellia bacterium]